RFFAYISRACRRISDCGAAQAPRLCDPCRGQGRSFGMNSQYRIAVAAGGTGGHLFSAAGPSPPRHPPRFEVHLVTDERAEKYGGDFPAHEIHKIAAASPSGGSVVSRAKAVVTLAQGAVAARKLFLKIMPDAVAGFGGYPAVPPLLAAAWLR